MNVYVKNDSLVVELIDHGTSFDPNQVSDPNMSQYIQTGKKGGLGIFIMKKFLDDIQYMSLEQANILRLIKFRKDGLIYPILLPISAVLKKLKEMLFPAKHKLIHNNSEV